MKLTIWLALMADERFKITVEPEIETDEIVLATPPAVTLKADVAAVVVERASL